MGKFEINKGKNGDYHFCFKAEKKIVLSSKGHEQKVSCMDNIRSVKKNAQNDTRFDLKISATGKYYFQLKGTSGRIIGISDMYEDELSMIRDIEVIKSHAPTAKVHDLT